MAPWVKPLSQMPHGMSSNLQSTHRSWVQHHSVCRQPRVHNSEPQETPTREVICWPAHAHAGIHSRMCTNLGPGQRVQLYSYTTLSSFYLCRVNGAQGGRVETRNQNAELKSTYIIVSGCVLELVTEVPFLLCRMKMIIKAISPGMSQGHTHKCWKDIVIYQDTCVCLYVCVTVCVRETVCDSV